MTLAWTFIGASVFISMGVWVGRIIRAGQFEPMSEPLCPECVAGKHQNCLGDALNPVTDEVTDCVCLHEV